MHVLTWSIFASNPFTKIETLGVAKSVVGFSIVFMVNFELRQWND